MVMNLDNFFNPKSVVVIGASRNPNKVGHVIMENLISGNSKRKIFPINQKGNKILGRKVYKSVLELEVKVDLGIVAFLRNLFYKLFLNVIKKK